MLPRLDLTEYRYTGKPVELTNDEGMQHVWVYDWGSPTGRQLFLDFVSDFLTRNQADGIFADKWGGGASRVNATTWKICNNRCGFINNSQAAAYNAGAVTVREQISALMHMNASSAAVPTYLPTSSGLVSLWRGSSRSD